MNFEEVNCKLKLLELLKPCPPETFHEWWEIIGGAAQSETDLGVQTEQADGVSMVYDQLRGERAEVQYMARITDLSQKVVYLREALTVIYAKSMNLMDKQGRFDPAAEYELANEIFMRAGEALGLKADE